MTQIFGAWLLAGMLQIHSSSTRNLSTTERPEMGLCINKPARRNTSPKHLSAQAVPGPIILRISWATIGGPCATAGVTFSSIFSEIIGTATLWDEPAWPHKAKIRRMVRLMSNPKMRSVSVALLLTRRGLSVVFFPGV